MTDNDLNIMQDSEVSTDSVLEYCNGLLNIGIYKDYCPNGLQVEGKKTISRLVSGVTACQALLDAAVGQQADAVLVHHGYFWKSDKLILTGMHKQRIKTLLDHDINLLAYHLPLDGHRTLGNNAQLAAQLDIQLDGVVDSGPAKNLLFYGHFNMALTGEEVVDLLSERLQHQPLHIAGSSTSIKTLAWCTGGAQHYLDEAVLLGVDAFISGEISEYTTHSAREQGIHYFAAGHHASERYGVQALGKHLADKFTLSHQFVDVHNPV